MTTGRKVRPLFPEGSNVRPEGDELYHRREDRWIREIHDAYGGDLNDHYLRDHPMFKEMYEAIERDRKRDRYRKRS